MLLVGLTGGIGSGKSTVARLLERHGAVVIDADQLARDAVAKGTPGFDRVVDAFGLDVVTSDGTFFLRRRLDGMAPFEDRPYAWLREGRP